MMNYFSDKLLPLETERLEIRLLDPSEAELMTRYVTDNRDFLLPWEPLRPEKFYTVEFWKHELERRKNDFYEGDGLNLVILPKGKPGGPVLGVCNYSSLMYGAFQACYLGYSVHQKCQGQGVMFEALTTTNEFIFKHIRLHRIMANYLPRNERSGKLLRRLGFVVEGYARDYLRIAGKWEDHILTSKISPYT